LYQHGKMADQLDRGHISEIENGKRAINIIALQMLARALDTTMSALLKGCSGLA
jgi:transcriptional regulator with XRE-family HTH domain